MKPEPKDLSKVPEHLRVYYTIGDACRTLTLADMAARRKAKETVDASLGGRKAA